jgi:hypothetical protein
MSRKVAAGIEESGRTAQSAGGTKVVNTFV